MTGHPDDKRVSVALGVELRRVREARNLKRDQVGDMLGITGRTVWGYENGDHHLNMDRFLAACRVMGADPVTVLQSAVQRARIDLETVMLRVDLHALLNAPTPILFRGIHQWIRGMLRHHPGGPVEVEPPAVKHLAWYMDCTHIELATYLAQFTPAPGE